MKYDHTFLKKHAINERAALLIVHVDVVIF